MALFDKSNLDKITELAKTVSDKAVEIAKNVGDKTSDMLELGKLNAQIAASKSSVEELKERLGDHYWQKFEKGETLDDDAVVLCNTIKEYMEEIEALKEQVAELKASVPPSSSAPTAALRTPTTPSSASSAELLLPRRKARRRATRQSAR